MNRQRHSPTIWIHPNELAIEPLEWDIPNAMRLELHNGMIVYLQADTELPLLDVRAIIRAGTVYEPPHLTGLAEITAETVRTGGIASPQRTMTSDDVDRHIEYLAGRLETYADREYSLASLSILEKDKTEGLALLRDMLMYPALDGKIIEHTKKKQIEDIRRQNDNPQQVAFREWLKLVYGAKSPWAMTPQVETIQSIQQTDVNDFYQRYYQPNNIILTVYGAFDPDRIEMELEELFQAWQPQPISFPAIPPITSTTSPELVVVPKVQEQSVIVLGHLGIRRNSPDYFPILVMNEILGGGFTSRMMREIRSNRGLSYGVYSRLTEGTEAGVFVSYCATKTESTREAIEVMTGIVREMKTAPPAPEEMELATESLLNNFVFQFDARSELVRRLAGLEFFGQPADFYQTYRENVVRVTAQDVQRVAETYLHPENLKILVVGDAEQLMVSLQPVGTPRLIHLNP
ncbi:MAG: insulinase family protein [Gemmatimonadetes bacterium]|nr:MAG: insulinase family protein [Gemmatimonadota bacterium]